MTEPLLGSSPAGFSEALKLRVLELKQRVQTGQATLSEIQEFLKIANQDLTKTKVKRNLPFKAEDVDFF